MSLEKAEQYIVEHEHSFEVEMQCVPPCAKCGGTECICTAVQENEII